MKNWEGLQVVVVGAARQGIAISRYFAAHGARVVLNDNRPPSQMADAQQALADLPVQWVLGSHPMDLLNHTDLVCVSGGVSLEIPMLVEARQRGIPLTNDSQVFMELVPCRTIGITGSAGKTTTTTLVGRMAHAGVALPSRVWVGGNIGLPLIAYIEEMKAEDLVILELSSFQLELMSLSPQVAAILNITPNHLDRHGSMETYTAAKARILDFQHPEDAAILGREDIGAWNLSKRIKGALSSFGLRHPASGQAGSFMEKGSLKFFDGKNETDLLRQDIIQLRGEHNIQNVLAACAIAAAAGLPQQAMQAGVEGFNGVPHRLEFIRNWRGADWYNDSIATAPERTMAAIRAFDEPLVLLAGGRDKKLPWEDFAQLASQRVDHLILFGEAAEKIKGAVGQIRPGQRPFTIHICEHLKDAVQQAAAVTEPGDVVLLSPGGTSFDEFHDFEERGERFIQWVKDLP